MRERKRIVYIVVRESRDLLLGRREKSVHLSYFTSSSAQLPDWIHTKVLLLLLLSLSILLFESFVEASLEGSLYRPGSPINNNKRRTFHCGCCEAQLSEKKKNMCRGIFLRFRTIVILNLGLKKTVTVKREPPNDGNDTFSRFDPSITKCF